MKASEVTREKNYSEMEYANMHMNEQHTVLGSCFSTEKCVCAEKSRERNRAFIMRPFNFLSGFILWIIEYHLK